MGCEGARGLPLGQVRDPFEKILVFDNAVKGVILQPFFIAIVFHEFMFFGREVVISAKF